jgi:transcriptional regulator with XRE-family HTH domain
MNTALTPKQIGKRIAEHRRKKGFSQQDLARFLEIPRSSVTQIELGNRNLTVIELMKLSESLGFSIDTFLAKEYLVPEEVAIVEETAVAYKPVRVSEPVLNIEKFRNVLLYILEQCAGKPNVGETVLHKLLYFCDFNYYELYEEHLTGVKYKKLSFGPAPYNFESMLIDMIDRGELQQIKTSYHSMPQIRYLPLKEADLKTFSAAAMEVIDRVIIQYSNSTAKMISEIAQNDKPWRATEENEPIDYELAFYRRPPYSVRVYEEDEQDNI